MGGSLAQSFGQGRGREVVVDRGGMMGNWRIRQAKVVGTGWWLVAAVR